jgi:hypothetical protein
MLSSQNNEKAAFLGTFALKNEKDKELLAKLIWAVKTGDTYYKSPLKKEG